MQTNEELMNINVYNQTEKNWKVNRWPQRLMTWQVTGFLVKIVSINIVSQVSYSFFLFSIIIIYSIINGIWFRVKLQRMTQLGISECVHWPIYILTGFYFLRTWTPDNLIFFGFSLRVWVIGAMHSTVL